ncbi:porphobilinogen synthase [Helicobacter saguini]|uniref:Delta-aminolevulinic acid dehydratase n=1 Tax=Helicobacter saguini TaxID=1548018 RepID=A0A347VQJ4_9HELI|nr:porphobilinogen synthase [Helicobacter saguini]MWV60922.1 porphobilinogen synthase [Helicobacter saguini]MWV68410.1 porphobilinogen synthase [Helicobacter saguini]MWV70126.1 porphobilinogen synthase [Helicobacter saguini]MWV72029.1 porphobilinogen synthase [Helicobacter saguini]TLD93747.1 porphobilinogen synthase [Helicobacter saguini]
MFQRFRRLRLNEVSRDLVRENFLSVSDFIYPLFIVEGKGVKNEMTSMPGVFQMSIDNILKECEELLNLGIKSVLLFGIIPDSKKDEKGTAACKADSIVATAAKEIKKQLPQMHIVADVCFCEYTSHGHCGILDSKGNVENDLTLEILAAQSLVLAQSGVDMLAPSSMMDGQIFAMRHALDKNGYYNLPIMSYSTKFASSFYGPFREVAQSTPTFGNRKGYQQDVANRREAILESLSDEKQGADILMVKPALAFLDIVRDIRERTLLPLAVYNVSGEYALLKAGAKLGVIDYEKVMIESLLSMKRAGADIIISYHAKEVAKILK